MKFRYTIQDYQTAAVDSVVRVFGGQPYHDRLEYRRDLGAPQDREQDLETAGQSDDELYMGFANAPVELSPTDLLHHIKTIQSENHIQESKQLAKHLGACSLDIEMETGTGKTYVYIKTMFELQRQYGWSKFIVVVPSVAIREGVEKSFTTMQDHFMELYGRKARFFVYHSSSLSDIDDFSSSADLSVMIINVQAFNAGFNKDKNKEGRGGDKAARIMFSRRDEFGSRRPIDVIAANRPIIIMDEPQKMGGDKTQKALKEFHSLFVLNYSATHKEHHDLVYVLDALDAFRMRLVKRIEVKGFTLKNLQGQSGYLYLEDIIVSPNRAPRARLEYEVKHKNGIKRETHVVGVGDSLYALSHELEQYDGYTISDIDPFANEIHFTGHDERLSKGEVVGDVSERDIRRVQIRETLRSHFEKEKSLYERGIKTLSLFFIDKVEHYRRYDDEGNALTSEYGEMFEQEYAAQAAEVLEREGDTAYARYLRGIDVHDTHAGYFSIDKKGRAVNSSVKRGMDTSDDESAYELILRDKERLLSFDSPVRFLFSHSALREGWDNPNVFQICTLKQGGDSTTNKRQEVGRGLRLCVDQQGDRMDSNALGDEVQTINKLTVIASDGYNEFVGKLQKDIKETLYQRPKKATEDYFTGQTLKVGEEMHTITPQEARAICHYLIKNEYVDDDDEIQPKYHEDVEANTVAKLPEKLADIGAGVHALIQSIFDEHALDGMIEDGRRTKIPENRLNENFSKQEFKTLWNYINHKYTYKVEYDTDELVAKAIAHINDKLFVKRLQYVVRTGQQSDDLTIRETNSSDYRIGSPESRPAGKGETYDVNITEASQIKYDLVGKVAEGTRLTRRSVARILGGIAPTRFAMFRENPEEFIAKTIKLILEEKATTIVDHITYNATAETYDSDIFTAEKHTDFARAYRAKKNVQDYVFADGYAEKSVERRFAEAMDGDDKVVVYAKLPRGFQIPTPVGNYAPDWAVAFKKGTVKHIFFVAETKGSMSSLQLKGIENAKIKCAHKLFETLAAKDVVYHEVDTYENLLAVMNSM